MIGQMHDRFARLGSTRSAGGVPLMESADGVEWSDAEAP